MDELFVPIPGYEGYFRINPYGVVYSETRRVHCGEGRYRLKQGKIIRHNRTRNGYMMAHLCADNETGHHLVHRLVAQTFIPNPNKLPEVNHKDENILNNHVSNLEWCTSKYNANYGTRNKKFGATKRKMGRAIVQFTKLGEFVQEYRCMAEAGESVNGDVSLISRCAMRKKNSPTAYGYIWRYRDELLPVKIA